MGLALAVSAALGVVGGCMSSPSSNTNTTNPNNNALAVQCDSVFQTDKSALYKVPVNGGPFPERLVGQLNLTWHVTVDNGMLYFTEDGTGNCTGRILKLHADAVQGTAPEVLVGGLNNPRSSFVNNGDLYFTEYGDNGAVDRVNLNTGIKTVLATGLNSPFAVVAITDQNGVSVYFSERGTQTNGYTDGAVKKIRVGSDGTITGVETLAGNLSVPVGVAVDSQYVYVVEMYGGRVFRMSRTASTIPPVQENLITGLSTPYPPVLEVQNNGINILYFADFNVGRPDAGRIYKLTGVNADPMNPITPADCGTGSASLSCTLLAESLSWPMNVAVDNNKVYWSEVWSASVKSIGKGGPPPAQMELASGVGFKKPLEIATDGMFVYFVDLGENTCCY